jgi:signal transduction histidine kinase
MRGLSPEHRRLVLVFAVLLLPLAALLGLQYRWLKRLERANAMARHAALDNYLHAVGNEVQYFYLTQAERVLNLPASLFIEQRIGSAAAFWEKKPVEGARTLFLVDFTQDTYGHYWVYEASSHSIVRALASDESLAIILACSPWQMLRFQHDPTSTGMPVADERDPQNRIILRPITDDAARVIGVTGMILDETYFRTRLLPNILTEALPGFFHDGGRNQTVVTVRDRRRELVLRTANDDQPDTVEHDFPFVFTDWTLGLHERGATPARWARANFALNMGLAVALALALAGGVWMALHAADRSMRLSQMKSDFVSNVSHELRTPLAAIRMFGELLRTGRVREPDRVREYGQRIETESQRLAHLVDNILDFARIESGHKLYRFTTVDLHDIVAPVVHAFEARLPAGAFRVRFESQSPEPLPAAVDSEAIAGALGNLLDNAVKYSGTGRDIRVRLQRDGEMAVIAVEDDGIGIESSEQAKIFDRFHRAGSALVHDVQGVGLGLAIVQQVAAAHRGQVTVESEPGRGSVFAIRLPLAAETATDASGAAAG